MENNISTYIDCIINNTKECNSEYFDKVRNFFNQNIDDITNILPKETISKLLFIAKDFYYNTENILIDDYTYDKLESYIGLENKNYIGSKSSAKHANYTVKHKFIMGSLSKIQIKEDKEGNVNWNDYANEFNKYIQKANKCKYYETTPKLDGCSFSAEFTVNKNNEFEFVSCATRGDGTYGSDIKHLFIPIMETSEYWNKIKECCLDILSPDENEYLCIRGEILVPLNIFTEKYSDKFVNPRSYVSGMLGLKADDIDKETILNSDLHFVCYDYRIYNKETNTYKEISWMNHHEVSYRLIYNYLNHIGELPDTKYCMLFPYNANITGDDIVNIYNVYDDYRKNKSIYALDGIVFKPNTSSRLYNDNRERPLDSVALKFIPMINETEIIDIEWNVKKTGEYFPKAIIKPIYLDGKEIKKASLHNYNYIINHNCGIGSIVKISLAGDIIPYVYEIVKPNGIDNINIPGDTSILTEKSGNIHLMKKFTDENEIMKNKFIASATALNINTIGPAISKMLWENLHTDSKNLDNIIYLMTDENYKLITDKLGSSKTIMNVINNLKEYKEHLTLEDIILSFCFKSCGHRASNLCAKIIRGKEYSTSSFSAIAYTWSLNPDSIEYKKVMNAVSLLNINIANNTEDTIINLNDNDKIPVILTGSPKSFGYISKKDFLNKHTEYIETVNWKECKILFTDDLNSTSSKMKKAAKLNIEIKEYF